MPRSKKELVTNLVPGSATAYQIDIQSETELTPLEHNHQRILTTEQIAVAHGTEPIIIRRNYQRNKERYVEGVHYYYLEKDELRQFMNHASNCRVVDRRIAHLYLWTERGAFLHAKSLNTDQAWAVYEALIDSYLKTQTATVANANTGLGADMRLIKQLFANIEALEQRLQVLEAPPPEPQAIPPREIPAGEYDMNELRKKKLTTRKEVPFYVGLGHSTIDKIIRRPDCQALVRIGIRRGRVFVNREWLDAYLNSHKG